MSHKWTKAQHTKFRATMQRKRTADSHALAQFEAKLSRLQPAPYRSADEPTIRVSQMAEFVVALVDAARRSRGGV